MSDTPRTTAAMRELERLRKAMNKDRAWNQWPMEPLSDPVGTECAKLERELAAVSAHTEILREVVRDLMRRHEDQDDWMASIDKASAALVLLELAKRAVAQPEPTEAEKIAGGVAFVMGPDVHATRKFNRGDNHGS